MELKLVTPVPKDSFSATTLDRAVTPDGDSRMGVDNLTIISRMEFVIWGIAFLICKPIFKVYYCWFSLFIIDPRTIGSTSPIPGPTVGGLPDDSLTALAAACCFDFNPTRDAEFVVGTEEGAIHKCSKAFSSQYLQSYEVWLEWHKYHSAFLKSHSRDVFILNTAFLLF